MTPHPVSEKSIRVVVFRGGVKLESDFKQFLILLRNHPSIDLVAVYVQSPKHSYAAIAVDLYRRRGGLAVPLFLLHVSEGLFSMLLHPVRSFRMHHDLKSLRPFFCFVPDLHNESVLQQVCEHSPDVGLAYGSPILRPELFEIPRRGTLGIHHGKAPKYRGRKTTFWEIMNDEPEAGVIIQKITSGLDTGSVIREGTVPIGRRGYRHVFRDVTELGLKLYIEAIEELHKGTAVFKPQEGEKGPLYRDPKAGDILRLWLRRLKP